MKNQTRFPLLLILMTLLLTGCSNLQNMAKAQKPQAQISSVTVSQLSLTEVTLLAKVTVKNPNPFKLPGVGLTLDLNIGGKKIVTVVQPDSSISLPAKGSRDITLPVTLKFTDLYRTVSGIKDTSSVAYEITGRINMKVPLLGDVSLPLSHKDTLPIPQLPDVSLQKVSVQEASFTRLRLTVDIAISNPNAFALNINTLNYQLSAAGKTLTSSSIKPLKLNTGERKTLSVPLSLSLSEAGSSVLRLLTGKAAVTYTLNGEMGIAPDLKAWKPKPLTFKSEKSLSL